jgi:D-sedoheptulose 7-phosphate isomerase
MKKQIEIQTQLLLKLANNQTLLKKIDKTVSLISESLGKNLPLLVCGNGGSASDALHISGELVGKFNLERKARNVICLNANTTVITAWSNDEDYDSVFARQVEAHGVAGAVCWGLSTSGNSRSIILAFEAAKRVGMITIGMTGEGGGKLAANSDILIDVPSSITPRVQELHLPIYHFICEKVEAELAQKESLRAEQ